MRAHQFGAIGALMIAGLLLPHRAAGQEVKERYQNRCSACHGTAGKGDGPVGKNLTPRPPDFSDAKRMAQVPDAKLTEVIIKGAKGMPAYGAMLKPVEVHELVGNIRGLSQKPAPQ